MEKNFCPECGVGTNIKQVICVKCGVSLENKVTKRKPIKEGNDNEYEGFYRSSNDKVLFGFCGGLAHKFGMQVSVVRILTLVSAFKFRWYIPSDAYLRAKNGFGGMEQQTMTFTIASVGCTAKT